MNEEDQGERERERGSAWGQEVRGGSGRSFFLES